MLEFDNSNLKKLRNNESRKKILSDLGLTIIKKIAMDDRISDLIKKDYIETICDIEKSKSTKEVLNKCSYCETEIHTRVPWRLSKNGEESFCCCDCMEKYKEEN